MDLSIVITTFNYGHYLEECLTSCILQNACGLKFEIIVVDDGSTDNTGTFLKQRFPDNVSVFTIDNCGIEKASNYGFSKARGEYIVRVDADDLLSPAYLLCIEKYINEEHGFFYSNYQMIDQRSKIIKEVKLPEFDCEEIKNRGDFLATGTLIKSNLIHEMGGYRTKTINTGLENYDLILRLIQSGVVGLRIPQTLFCYRRHSNNFSELKKEQIIQNGKDLFAHNGLGRFKTNKFHPYGLEI